ncbi:MAG: DUF4982 domain-containing protein [Oscillospiraceae bacterium]|nr:DUF4982 domain-containing protein [Oscillospiraceae bacterium]
MKHSVKSIALLTALLLLLTSIPATIPIFTTAEGSIMTDTPRDSSFNDGWRFSIGTNTGAENPAYADHSWADVELPHDWLISQPGNFYKSDIGWYRKTFYLPESLSGKRVAVRFDGVYMDCTVYVNGQKAGDWKYGYTSFQFDITPYLQYGNKPNVIAVRVNHQSGNTRWYSGAGIYRNVWLTVTDPVHVDWNGMYVSTDGNTVSVQTEVRNASASTAAVTVRQTVLNAAGQSVATNTGTAFNVAAGTVQKNSQTLTVPSPTLWDLNDPYLYTLKTEILVGGNVRDEYRTDFGFRKVEIKPQEGFFLNGKYMKLHGVNMHHDLGALGSAINVRALERQLEIMQEMGANAIRTSHNPPAPELLELCDRMGILVIDEAFDMWADAKNSNDYHRFFTEWSELDARAWVRRDRNHPCVIMWSIGNEVTDTQRTDGVATANRLKGYVLEEDPNRNAKLTIGSNYMANSNAITIGRSLGSAGYNYIEELYDEHHIKYPDMALYAAESASAVRSRGVYHLPTDKNILTYFDQQCSSYDNSVVPWGDSAEQAWKWDRDRPYVLGQFVWTGFDYIGEPIPYSTKNAYFGIVDTAGIPKDIYYFYQSIWTDKPMVHLLPHWDWNEGDIVPVWAYSNADSMELYLNGSLLSKQKMDLTGDVLHAEWLVPYQKGTLEVTAYNATGNAVATDRISSCGDGTQLKLTPDRHQMTADGKDLMFVEVSVLDKDGNFVPNARNRVLISVSGAGKLVGVDNGDSTDFRSYQTPLCKAFSGKLMAIIQNDGNLGEITVMADSPGLEPASVSFFAGRYQMVAGITLSAIDGSTAITADKGRLKIQAAVSPVDANYQKLDWSVVNADGTATDKAYIDQNGVLKALRNGTVKVIAAALDGSGESAELTVSISNQAAFTAVTGITVSMKQTPSGQFQYSAEVAPAGALVKEVDWSVSSMSVINHIDKNGLLTVDNGGEVTVRATAKDGSGVFSEGMLCTEPWLFSQEVPARKVTLSLTNGQTAINGLNSAKVRAAILPAGASYTNIDWSIRDEHGINISDIGKLNKNADGTVTVSARYNGQFTLCAAGRNSGSQWPQAYTLMTFTAAGLRDKTISAYKTIKARDYDFGSKVFGLEGADNDRSIGSIFAGDWCGFRALDFKDNPSVNIKITGGLGNSAPTNIEVHDGAPDGPLLATLAFASTGGWHNFQTRTFPLEGLTGAYDLYFVFKSGFVFNGFVFDPTDPPEEEQEYAFILGDVNGSGDVSITDARLVLQHLVGKAALTKEQQDAADVDGDGNVTISDARLMLQYLVGKITEFPQGTA